MGRNNNNWSGKVIRWRPWEEKRSTDRLQQRWYDDIKQAVGLNWHQIAVNLREVYAQRTENG